MTEARTPPTLVAWPCQAVYCGAGFSSELHQHRFSQISLGFGPPLRVRTRASEPFLAQTSFVAGPLVPHQTDMDGLASFSFWSEDPALADFAQTLSRKSGSELPPIPPEAMNRLLPELNAYQRGAQDARTAQALVSEILDILLGPDRKRPAEEPRIATVRSVVTPRFLRTESRPIRRLADLVYLSPSRFRHLFRGQTGMSVQSYLLWRRLVAAIWSSLEGDSLTGAAHTLGFADSAHLSRVFRSMFGMPPSRMLQNRRDIKIVLGPACDCQDTDPDQPRS